MECNPHLLVLYRLLLSSHLHRLHCFPSSGQQAALFVLVALLQRVGIHVQGIQLTLVGLDLLAQPHKLLPFSSILVFGKSLNKGVQQSTRLSKFQSGSRS